MSDDDTKLEGELRLNLGATLPDNTTATHNAGLSSLFLNRSGFSRASEGSMLIDGRGQGNYLRSTTAFHNGRSYFLQVGPDYIFPNQETNTFYLFSLRCLVSTNNG